MSVLHDDMAMYSNMATYYPTFTFVFTGTPVIISEKLLVVANYLSWAAAAAELWFIGQGHEDHMTKQAEDIPDAKCSKWKNNAQLRGPLWQSIDWSLAVQH